MGIAGIKSSTVVHRISVGRASGFQVLGQGFYGVRAKGYGFPVGGILEISILNSYWGWVLLYQKCKIVQ